MAEDLKILTLDSLKLTSVEYKCYSAIFHEFSEFSEGHHCTSQSNDSGYYERSQISVLRLRGWLGIRFPTLSSSQIDLITKTVTVRRAEGQLSNMNGVDFFAVVRAALHVSRGKEMDMQWVFEPGIQISGTLCYFFAHRDIVSITAENLPDYLLRPRPVTHSKPGFASHPVPEILAQIFDYVDPKPWDRTLELKTFLLPFLFVNRRWSGIAQLKFYRSIGVGVRSDYVCSTRLLRRTLAENSTLASYVLKLSLHPNTKSEAQDHLAILTLCTNLKHVRLSSYCHHLLKYHHAMAERSLASLRVAELSIGPQQRSFWTPEVLLDMLSGWPDIENLMMMWERPVAAFNRRSRSLCCPHLKMISLHSIDDLCDAFFCELGEMANRVEIFLCQDGFRSAPLLGIFSALRSWSYTLRRLQLDTSAELDAAHFEFPHLPNLQELRITSSILPAVRLPVSTPRLLSLYYTAPLEEFRLMTSVLDDSSALPLLTGFAVSPIIKHLVIFSDVEEALAGVCARRGIHFSLFHDYIDEK